MVAHVLCDDAEAGRLALIMVKLCRLVSSGYSIAPLVIWQIAQLHTTVGKGAQLFN